MHASFGILSKPQISKINHNSLLLACVTVWHCFLHTVIQGPRMLGLPSARWNIVTIQRIPNERNHHSSHSSSASWVPGTVLRLTILSSQQHFVKKPGLGKAHAQFSPTTSQVLNHSTLHQLCDLCWCCTPEKWQLIQKHVEQKWIFSPEMKGKKYKRNALVDCKRFQSCKCFCYIALIWTVNKQFVGKVEYIKIYSWNKIATKKKIATD